MSIGFDAEKRAVDALLTSSMFQRAPNLRKLVSFLWEQYAQGNTSQIKEYTIATEVLGRPPSFDQKRDAIVRVEMHRLRKRLREYYEGPGAADDVVMYIPEGNYVPVFEHRTPTALAPAASETIIESDAEEVYPEAWPEDDQPKVPVPVMPARVVRQRSRPWWTAAAVVGLGVVLFGLILGAVISRNSPVAARPAVAAPAIPDLGAASPGVRILSGQEKIEPRLDHLGQVWLPDRFFTGGTARTGSHGPISGATEQFVFEGRREGDFHYDIPLDPGYYEVRLYFAEPVYGEGNVAGMGESSRLFSMDLNGKPALELFDIIADAGGSNTAAVKVFKSVTPGEDGRLHLTFNSYANGRPTLNAVEIRPSPKGHMLPIRMVAQQQPVRDAAGHVWLPDEWVTGGVRIPRPNPPADAGGDRALYTGERFGNFTYRIPVAPGTYQVTTYMSEAWFGPKAEGGGGRGSRVFSVFCNHRPLLESFDLFAAAGDTGRSYRRVFTGLKPDSRGKLVLQFEPDANYAMVNALSIEDVSAVE